MDLISIIVPVYKVEKYLDRCVESIVGQTYTNLEIILVDDGSPDQCPAMCDAWARRDGRIRVIHKANGGLSDARNAGVAAANGRYIGFVDSDDWIDSDFYEVLRNALMINRAQISAANVIMEFEDHSEGSKDNTQTVFNSQDAIATIMHGDGFRATAWNKLYEKELISQFPFPTGKYHEDEFVCFRVLDKAERMVLCRQTAYHYRQRQGGIMGSVSAKHLDALDAFLERVLFLKEKYPELYLEDRVSLCIACLNHYGMALNGQYSDRKQARTRIADIRKQVHFTFSEFKGLSLKNKFYVVGSARYCIAAFAGLRNIRGGH